MTDPEPSWEINLPTGSNRLFQVVCEIKPISQRESWQNFFELADGVGEDGVVAVSDKNQTYHIMIFLDPAQFERMFDAVTVSCFSHVQVGLMLDYEGHLVKGLTVFAFDFPADLSLYIEAKK